MNLSPISAYVISNRILYDQVDNVRLRRIGFSSVFLTELPFLLFLAEPAVSRSESLRALFSVRRAMKVVSAGTSAHGHLISAGDRLRVAHLPRDRWQDAPLSYEKGKHEGEQKVPSSRKGKKTFY